MPRRSMMIATACAGLLGVVSATWRYPPCAKGMTCIKLRPYDDQDLEFDCAVVNTSLPLKGNVYAMHGDDGKYAKAMFAHHRWIVTHDHTSHRLPTRSVSSDVGERPERGSKINDQTSPPQNNK